MHPGHLMFLQGHSERFKLKNKQTVNLEQKSTRRHLHLYLIVQLEELRRVPSVVVMTKFTVAWKKQKRWWRN